MAAFISRDRRSFIISSGSVIPAIRPVISSYSLLAVLFAFGTGNVGKGLSCEWKVGDTGSTRGFRSETESQLWHKKCKGVSGTYLILPVSCCEPLGEDSALGFSVDLLVLAQRDPNSCEQPGRAAAAREYERLALLVEAAVDGTPGCDPGTDRSHCTAAHLAVVEDRRARRRLDSLVPAVVVVRIGGAPPRVHALDRLLGDKLLAGLLVVVLVGRLRLGHSTHLDRTIGRIDHGPRSRHSGHRNSHYHSSRHIVHSRSRLLGCTGRNGGRIVADHAHSALAAARTVGAPAAAGMRCCMPFCSIPLCSSLFHALFLFPEENTSYFRIRASVERRSGQ